MGQGQFYPIRPPSETARVAGHGREIERLQRRNPEPRWMYATPVAPATAPDDYRSGDTLYPAFQSPWGNLDSSHLPFSYRFAYGAIQLRGTITGGEATPNSLIATIPSTYPRPTEKEQHLVFMGSDGSSIGLVEANTDGTLVFIGLAAGTGSPFVGLGGKVPWFETLYLTSSGASGAPILANDFGGTSSRIRTTDNAAGYTENSTGPQVYTDGAYFACDYSTSPSIAVQVLQAGVYMIHVERLIAYGEISADVNASIGVMVTMGSGHTAFFADSRVIDDSMLTDANAGLFTMNIGRVDAARAVYIDSPATIQVEYMNEGVVGDSQIWLSIFRVSDGDGNSAPGTGATSSTDRAIYDSGGAVSIPTGVNTRVNLSLQSGSALLDLAGNPFPGAVTAGVYAATLNVRCTSGAHAGEFFHILLDLDGLGEDAFGAAIFPLEVVDGAAFPEGSVSATYYVPASTDPSGGAVSVAIEHAHGSSLNFTLTLFLQRLS